MSENNKYYSTININKKLLQERSDLFKQYETAIERDLPFEETKKIYLRLKEIGRQLKNENQSVESTG
jgi:hypothetical protein